MIKNNYTCGIDIGTQTTRVFITTYNKGEEKPSLLTVGSSLTEGVKRGYIVDIDLVAKSIKTAIVNAEKTIDIKIRRAFVSIGGISLNSIVSTGSVIISKSDQEITDLDVSKALLSSEKGLDLLNKKIVHIIPLSYKLDGKEIYTRPEGMHGAKLEVKTLFVTCLKQNINDIATAFEIVKIEIEDIIASPVAESLVLLNSKQKAAGCALINIGFETVSMAVYENNVLISLRVFPIGSMDITKDIALCLKISLEEAESIKLGSVIGGNYSKKKINEIIEARLNDIFELIENQLKRLRRNELLPAGIILSGGGTYINNIEELAREQLKLPIRLGPIDTNINNKFKIHDSSWYTSFGLTLASKENYSDNNINNIISQLKIKIKSIFSQLLP